MKTKKHLLTIVTMLCFVMLLSVKSNASWQNVKGGEKRYYISSTEYVKSKWYRISKNWFYFDEKGYVKTGRFKVVDQYFYCTANKGRVTNKQVGSYYYGKEGVMLKNVWKKIHGHYYYFDSKGCIRYGKFTVNSKTFYCTKKSGRVTNKRVGKNYYDKNGVMVKNCWVKNFYYDSKGIMKTGKFTAVNGKTYYCDKEKGKLTSQWKNKNYYDKNGVMATSCWIKDSYVNEKGIITEGNKNPVNPPSASDIRWLSAITYLEAGNQSYYGKKCVASVIMNRVYSKKFPNTIKSVLYQSGQFTPAINGELRRLYNSKSSIQSQSVKAAKYVLEHGSVLKNYYYFNNSGYGMKIGDHYFS